MKQGLFMTMVAVVALAIAIVVYMFLPDYIRKGGPLVALLIMLSIMSVTLTFERLFTLNRARGKMPVPAFMREIRKRLDSGDIEGAAELCAKQRGSLANVLRAGLDRYLVVRNVNLDLKTRMEEVQKAMEEANMLAIFSIVLYNVFVTMIDNFNYMMDEATVEVVEVLSMKEATK